MKQWAIHGEPPRIGRSQRRNVVHWRRKWQITSVSLPQECQEEYKWDQKKKTGRWAQQVGRYPIYYWGIHTFISLSRVWTSSWQKVCKAWCWKKLLRVPWTGRISVYPRGNQLWIFIGRTDADAKAPILWLPDVKSQYLGKDPDAGKDWGQEEKWWQRMRRLNGITDSMDMSLSKLW